MISVPPQRLVLLAVLTMMLFARSSGWRAATLVRARVPHPLARQAAQYSPYPSYPSSRAFCQALGASNKDSASLDAQKLLPNVSERDLYKHVRRRDFPAAMAVYDAMVECNVPRKDSQLLALLACCHKAEHLSKAQEIVSDMSAAHIPLSQTSYLALVRCHADAGELEEALVLIREMVKGGIEARQRAFQPLLEKLSDLGDVTSLLDLIDYMDTVEVPVRGEQITALATSMGHDKVRWALRDAAVADRVTHIFQQAADGLLGLSTAEISLIVERVNNITVEQVADQGVLVGSLEDIRSRILSMENASIDGSVVALNASFEGARTVLDRDLPPSGSNDPRIPVGQDATTVQLVPEKYVVLSERARLMNATMEQSLGNTSVVTPDIDEGYNTTSCVDKFAPARVVDISPASCRCPNCDAQILPLLLTGVEKLQVRSALQTIARGKSLNQSRHLECFADWLRDRDEYEYIVDAANVAYFNQNFETGRFSYKQVELVVDALRERSDKVLVVIPHCYAAVEPGGFIPNSVRWSKAEKGGTASRRGLSPVSEEDCAVIKRLEERGMLYVVPRGANDDWYWLYATIYEGRKRPALVISNDLMRDHKVAFIEPKPFLRWRNSQIIYFGLSKAVEEQKIKEEGNPSVYLHEPGNFSREIQGPQGGRWHIPAVDRSLWLCLSAAPPPHEDGDRVSQALPQMPLPRAR